MFFRIQSVLFLFTILAIGAWSCGSGDSNKRGTTLQTYQPKPASTHLRGFVEGVDELHFVLFNDRQTDTMVVFSVEGGAIDVILEKIPANEVYFLEIRGRADGYEEQTVYWREVVPMYAQDGAELELVSVETEDDYSLSNRRFHLEGGGEEQDFLESWYRAVSEKQDELDDQISHQFVIGGGQQARAQRQAIESGRQELEQINRDFIAQGKPLIATLFLISQENDHRSKVKEYEEIYDKVSAEARQTKYGIDLNNRLIRITQFNPQLDFENLLAARNSQLHNFDPASFADHEYLLITFWSSRFPQALEELPKVEELVSETGADHIAVIHFSLDAKMSAWKSASEKIELNNSYLLRAEVRQKAIDELYLTELPRYMVVKSDGTVVENDVPYEDLKEVIDAL